MARKQAPVKVEESAEGRSTRGGSKRRGESPPRPARASKRGRARPDDRAGDEEAASDAPPAAEAQTAAEDEAAAEEHGGHTGGASDAAAAADAGASADVNAVLPAPADAAAAPATEALASGEVAAGEPGGVGLGGGGGGGFDGGALGGGAEVPGADGDGDGAGTAAAAEEAAAAEAEAAAVAAAAAAAVAMPPPHPMAIQDPDMARSQVEAIKRADMEQVARAKKAGTLVTVQLQVELPPELQDAEFVGRFGLLEVPVTSGVAVLKRLIMYASNMQLLPSLQRLFTVTGEEMVDYKEDGSLMTLSAYALTDGATAVLRVMVPDEASAIPIVHEAATASYPLSLPPPMPALPSSGGNALVAGRPTTRKQRWSLEQIEALVEGVERHGLSSWRTIVSDPRLAEKNNMQCKDKFRNLCLTIIQGRPERGLTLTWSLKERVKAVIEQERLTFN